MVTKRPPTLQRLLSKEEKEKQAEVTEWIMKSLDQESCWLKKVDGGIAKSSLDVIARQNRLDHFNRIKEFEQLINENQEDIKQPEYPRAFDIEDLVAGPAVKWSWIANGITWVGFVFLTMGVAFYTNINEKGISDSVFSQGKGGSLVIVAWLLTTLLPIWCECKAALYIIPAQTSNIGEPGILGGCGKGWLSFNGYLVFLLALSFILHSDILTSAVFVGRTFKATHSCDGSIKKWSMHWFWHGDPLSPLELKWKHAVNNSKFFRMLHLNSFTFWQLALISWLLLLLQFFYAVAYAMPVSPDFRNEHYEKEVCKKLRCCKRYTLVTGDTTYHGLDPDTGPRRRSLYHTTVTKFTTHGRCLQALGDSGRMMSIQWFDDEYIVKASEEWPLGELIQQMNRANWRFLLFSLQAICMPNLQVTFSGVQKSLNGSAEEVGASDWVTVASVVLGVLSGIKYILWEVKTLISNIRLLYFSEKSMMERYSAFESSKPCEHAILRKHKIWMHKINAFATVFIGVCIAFAATSQLLFLVVKVVMELTQCPSGSWNATSNIFHLSSGCVDTIKTQEASVYNPHGWTGGWHVDQCDTGLEIFT